VEGLGGSFSVFKRVDPANLRFTDLIISPAEVLPGEPVRISFVVANQGDESGRTEIELRINKVLTELRSISVPGKDQVRVVFQFVAPAVGTFDVELIDPEELVPSVKGQIVASVPQKPATFVLDRPVITPLEVGPGQQVTISTRLTNFGDLEGALTAILRVNDVEVARQDVFREPLVGGPVVFTITASKEPGTYGVSIAGEVLVGEPAIFPVDAVFKVLEVVPGVTIQSVALSPDPVRAGGSLTLRVEVTNSTAREATRILTLKVDGAQVGAERPVTVGARETRTETFTFSAPGVFGTHTLEVDGLVREFSVVAAAVLNLVEPLVITPDVLLPGQQAIAIVVVRNTGGEAASTDIIVRARGREVARQRVEVRGGQEKRVELPFVVAEPGDVPVEVEVAEAVEKRTAQLTITVISPLTAVPETAKVEPRSVTSGNPVVISVDVANRTTLAGTGTFVLTVDGQRVEERKITLQAGETVTASFTYVEEKVGKHTARVDGAQVEFEVVEVVEAPAPAAGFPIIIVLVVVIVVVVALGAGGYLVYRRRSAGGAPPAAGAA
jgi:hypothetical protein